MLDSTDLKLVGKEQARDKGECIIGKYDTLRRDGKGCRTDEIKEVKRAHNKKEGKKEMMTGNELSNSRIEE